MQELDYSIVIKIRISYIKHKLSNSHDTHNSHIMGRIRNNFIKLLIKTINIYLYFSISCELDSLFYLLF